MNAINQQKEPGVGNDAGQFAIKESVNVQITTSDRAYVEERWDNDRCYVTTSFPGGNEAAGMYRYRIGGKEGGGPLAIDDALNTLQQDLAQLSWLSRRMNPRHFHISIRGVLDGFRGWQQRYWAPAAQAAA